MSMLYDIMEAGNGVAGSSRGFRLFAGPAGCLIQSATRCLIRRFHG